MARTPKVAQAPTRHAEILAIAAQVVAERGIKGATVRDIGQAVGILSGSLYHHFESKEQIILEMLLPNGQAQYDRSVAIRAAAADAPAALTALIHESVMATASHPNESLILRYEARTFADLPALAPVAELRRKMLALWLDVVKQGVASGDFRGDLDADVAVRAMFDGVLGAARWFAGSSSTAPDRVSASLGGLHVDGLRRT